MSTCSSETGFLSYFDENRLFYFLTTFTFAVIFIFIYILRVYTFFDTRSIPRAVRPSAPFGNIKDVVFQTQTAPHIQDTTLHIYLWKYYNKFKRKQFKYGGIYLFFKPSILVVDSALQQKIALNKSVSDLHDKRFSQDIVMIFNDSNLESFLGKYNAIKDSLLMDLSDKCVSVVMHNYFMETTSLAFGFKTSLDFLTIINSLLKRKSEASFKYYFGLAYPLFKRRINFTDDMQQLVKDVLNHRKKNDIREVDLLQSVADLVNKGKYNFKELVEDVFNIFVDNIIHSYGTLLFCLYELASNKQIQQCVIEELVRLKPDNNKSLQLESLRQLPYLDAVVKETLRKYPAVPTIIRKCNEHCSINGEGFGFELPKGTLLFYSVMGVHRDPSNYPDPNKFDPDRFIEAVNKQCDTSDTYYMPFGIDNTKNIGLRFTTLHIKLSLISIFTKYKVKLNNVCPLEFDNKKLPLFPKEPVPICFESL